MATTILLKEKTELFVPSEEHDSMAPFAISITNIGTLLQDLGPRCYQDVQRQSVFEMLYELEDNARIAYFQKKAFNKIEAIYYGNEHCAVFSFKELRKTENGAFEACYEYKYLTCDIEEIYF